MSDRHLEIITEDGLSMLEDVLVARLREKGHTLSCAESCTGGLLSGRIIDVAGVSDVYKAGFVTYANEAKEKHLGVTSEALCLYGAVSEQVAAQMVLGACKASGSSVSLATTGIAGPGGGTAEKPVGLVYIACCVDGDVTVERHVFDGNRRQVREAAVEAALLLLEKCLG